MRPALRSVFLAAAALLTFVLNVIGYTLTLGYAALMFFEVAHAPRLEHTRVMMVVTHWLSPSIREASSWFGWSWPHHGNPNFMPLILAVVVFWARSFLVTVVSNVEASVRGRWRRVPTVVSVAPPPAAAANIIRGAETEQERTALLKRYRELEDALKSSARKRCSFLAIDVVGSTQMKVGEDPTAIAATFQAYEEMVRRAFEAHGIWKSAWTPDGVMACFLDRELAVRAAQEVLVSLRAFNAGQNRLKAQFKVRCGLNEGEVVIFEDSQLEKISDRAIDVAGHLQKLADENTLQVSEEVFSALQDPKDFNATGNQVDGVETFEWTVAAETLVERAEDVIESITHATTEHIAQSIGGKSAKWASRLLRR